MLPSLVVFGSIILAAACFVVDLGDFAFYIFNAAFLIGGSWLSISNSGNVPTTQHANAYFVLILLTGFTLNTVFRFVGFLMWAAGVKYFVSNFVYDDMLRVLNTSSSLKPVADIIEGLE